LVKILAKRKPASAEPFVADQYPFVQLGVWIDRETRGARAGVMGGVSRKTILLIGAHFHAASAAVINKRTVSFDADSLPGNRLSAEYSYPENDFDSHGRCLWPLSLLFDPSIIWPHGCTDEGVAPLRDYIPIVASSLLSPPW